MRDRGPEEEGLGSEMLLAGSLLLLNGTQVAFHKKIHVWGN